MSVFLFVYLFYCACLRLADITTFVEKTTDTCTNKPKGVGVAG